MEINSPLQEINLPSGFKIWIKRDDLIDPYISGNKWRKLKYILQDTQRKQKTHLVTFGGTYSNHLVATAAAAARHQLKATAFVRGEEVHNEMLALCRLFDMQLIFIDRENYRHKAHLFIQHFGDDQHAYFIDEGGACEEAVRGCAEIIDELPMRFDHVFCAAGTGTTAAGLLRGLKENSDPAKLHVVPVLKDSEFLRNDIGRYQNDLSSMIMHFEYHFGGYAKTTPALIDFIKHFSANTGILIDPVYTGKLFYAIDDLCQKGFFNPDEKILAVHTGGLLGIMGMKDKFQKD